MDRQKFIATIIASLAAALGLGKAHPTTDDEWHHVLAVSDGSTSSIWLDGEYVAESAVWGVALREEEIRQLARGVLPRFVRPKELLDYWPLRRAI